MTILDYTLADKNILVTGATGFIGGHLAHRLATVEKANVTGTGRKLDNAAWLDGTGVRLQRADLTDRDAMAAVIAGQQIIFHVGAYLGNMIHQDLAYAINVEATRQLVELAAAADVQRVVYVSSIAAYDVPTQDHVPSTTPVATEQADTYGRTKAQGEIEALKIGRKHNLDITIVRPGMVIGPRSGSWTVQMLKLVQSGTPVIFGRGDGHASPVYIDNLTDILLLAATRPTAVGHAFNAVDQPVPFRDFFSYYGRMCGRKPRTLPYPVAYLIAWITDTFRLKFPLSRARLGFYKRKTVYAMDDVKQLLDYTPRISIDEAMQHSETWLRRTGYLAA